MGAENRVALTARTANGRIEIEAGTTNRAAALPAGDRVLNGPAEGRFRSEAAELSPRAGSKGADDALVLEGVVTQASYPGGVWRHVVAIGDMSVVVDSSRAFASGEGVLVRIPSESLFLFASPSATEAAREMAANAPQGQ